MARIAVADGIRVSVLTPHIHPDLYGNTRGSLRGAFDVFAKRLREEAIPLEIKLGGEVWFSIELLDLIDRDEVPFLGEVDGYRIMLIEFPPRMIPIGSDKLATVLLRRKIRPLIAHPERNMAVMESLDKLRPFVDMGCWLQLTAGSLSGRFNPVIGQTAWRLLESGWNCIVATDAHDLRHRPPLLSEGRDALAKRFGEQFALDHVRFRPARILGMPAGPAAA